MAFLLKGVGGGGGGWGFRRGLGEDEEKMIVQKEGRWWSFYGDRMPMGGEVEDKKWERNRRFLGT